jgi:dipeptidyl aminopeptidase/acylaminoacyl peptidase
MSERLSTSSARRFSLVLAATLLAALCLPLYARASDFGPIELISKSSREQAEVGSEPALSADGRYAAFCAMLAGREGIFREELATDLLTPVAVGPITGRCGNGAYASAPSISADGRYVSFMTKASLLPADTEANKSDVYVADLSTSPPTYEMASVVADPEDTEEPEPMPGGSVVAGRVALSADGERIAFVNAGNVYVRDLATKKTILISAKRNPLTGMTEEPVAGGGAYEPAGATISADGSTVAWVGEHLPEQVPLLGDEEATIKGIEKGGLSAGRQSQYHEPLWRRVSSASEETPPTRRIVGGSDPLAPGCSPSGSIKETQCQGPYPEVVKVAEAGSLGGSARKSVEFVLEENGSGWGVKLPRLDADGDEVALAGDPGEQYDLFVVDMEEGLDRRQAVRQVTQWTNPVPQANNLSEVLRGQNTPELLPFTGEIAECAISPDGTRVAFATTRQRLAMAPYTLVTELPSAVGLMPELYELDLESDKIERATPGPENGVSTWAGRTQPSGVGSISFGGGDRLIAFSSGADNLVGGDANERSDAFVVESFPPTPVGTSSISPRPPQSTIQPTWRMTANAYSRPDGSLQVVAQVPGAGTLRGSARAQVGGHLKSRRVASGSRRSGIAGTLIFDLKLGRGRQVLARKPGLVARVHLTFTGGGGRPLRADLQGRFLVHPKRKRTNADGKRATL